MADKGEQNNNDPQNGNVPQANFLQSKFVLWVGMASSVVTVISLFFDQQIATYVLCFIAVASLACWAWHKLGRHLADLKRILWVLLKLSRQADQLSNLSTFLGDEIEDLEDRKRLVDCSDEITDLCRAVDAHISSYGSEFPRDISAKAWTIAGLKSIDPLIANVFRKFSGCEVSVLIQVRDEDKLKTILFDSGISPRRLKVQPLTVPIAGSVPGKVLEDGKGIVMAEVGALSVDECWNGRCDFIKSIVAWPIYIEAEARAVLKIDSPTAGAFRDGPSIRLLAELCSRKIGVLCQTGRLLERFQESSGNEFVPAGGVNGSDAPDEGDQDGSIHKRKPKG